MTLSQIYFTHTSDLGVRYEARPMPEEHVKHHLSVLHKTDSGTLIRVYIIDPNETRKFKQILTGEEIVISEDGEEGFIGYWDYKLEEDGSVTNRAYYLHPLHRNRQISRDVAFFVIGLAEDGTVFNDHVISNPYIANLWDEIIDDIAVKGKDIVFIYNGKSN